MALRITTDLVKFKNLVIDLNLPLYQAIGLLESIWHFTAKNAIRGDIGRHSNKEIAEWIGWEGDADEMIRVLTLRNWLDPHPKYRLIVHDWHIHADKSIKTIMRNRKLCFAQEEELTQVPKEITGAPIVISGGPPECREQSAESRVQSPESRVQGADLCLPETPEQKAADLATEFRFYFQGKKPFLDDLRSAFAEKMRVYGADKYEFK